MISHMVEEKSDVKGSNPGKGSKKFRNVQFTLNEIEKWNDLRLYLTSLKNLQYIIAGKEKAPTTGHEHIHCYCQFRKPQTISFSKMQGAHSEECKGSAQENIGYVKKPGAEIIFEDGTPLFKGGHTIAAIKAMSKEEREKLPIQYYKIVKDINQNEGNLIDLSKEEQRKEDMRVYWIWGPSGEGKTTMAYEMFKNAGITKICQVYKSDRFWIGVNENAEGVLYDDFRDSDMRPKDLIYFIDYNVHAMEVKGGHIQNEYKRYVRSW